MSPKSSFTRQDVCLLANLSLAQFQNLNRRNQLPIIVSPDDEPNEESKSGRAWGRFSAEDVLLVAIVQKLLMEIGAASGLRPETARKLAYEARRMMDEVAREPLRDIWFGYVGRSPSSTYDVHSGKFYGGTIEEIAEWVQTSYDDGPPVRLYLVNVSHVLREVEQRARANNVQFAL